MHESMCQILLFFCSETFFISFRMTFKFFNMIYDILENMPLLFIFNFLFSFFFNFPPILACFSLIILSIFPPSSNCTSYFLCLKLSEVLCDPFTSLLNFLLKCLTETYFHVCLLRGTYCTLEFLCAFTLFYFFSKNLSLAVIITTSCLFFYSFSCSPKYMLRKSIYFVNFTNFIYFTQI